MAGRAEVFAVAIVFVVNLQGAVGPLDMGTAFTWGMAAFQKSETGNALTQALTSLKDMPDTLYTGTQQVIGSIDAAANALLGECDGPALVALIKPKLKLKSVPKSKCLQGAKFTFDDKVLTTIEGSLHINKDDLKIEGVHHEEEDDTSSSQTIFLSFKFSDLFFTYKFISKPNYRLSREGRVRYVLRGPNSVSMRVRIPRELSEVTAESKKDTCFVRIREMGFQLGKIVEVDDLWYNSAVNNLSNKGLTKSDFSKTVKIQQVRNAFIDVIKTSLKKALEPILKDDKVFCDSKKLTVSPPPKCTEKDVLNVKVDLNV